MPNIGLPELAIVLVIVLLIFGPKKLPGLGRSLGSGMREFKDSLTGDSKDDDELEPPAAAEAPVQPVTQQVPVQQAAPPASAPVAPAPAPVDPADAHPAQAAPPATPANPAPQAPAPVEQPAQPQSPAE